MAESLHYRDLLRLLNDCRVEYLIVGGYAVMKYTEPLYTKDLDVWVRSSPENSARVFDALAKFGAPLQHDEITSETFSRDNIVYQIGVAPVRIDVLTSITGVRFTEAWSRRVSGNLFGVAVNFISVDDLIANKDAAGRSSDLKHLKQFRSDEDQ
ncbi:MAG TPA: nucleotidyltransferase [Bryobacteraceae bacterium]|nr:nucleotidyltransferase [Bryobacteraceae bacterium]